MRGHLVKKYKGSWCIVLDVERRVDPVTGRSKRIRKWFSVKGTKQAAEQKLTELLERARTGQVIEPSKLTLGQWLDEWLESAIKPPHKRIGTYETYRSDIKGHLKPKLGSIRLWDLRASHIQAYYDQSPLAAATLQKHHAVLSNALKQAERQGLVQKNVASLVIGKPKQREGHEAAMQNCWEEEEARRFVATVKAAGPQAAAFYVLALSTGLRKGELCGLTWSAVDLKAGTMSIVRQLVKTGARPTFGPTKTGRSRTIALDGETVELLRRHRAHQAAGRLELGTTYVDHGLVFAREFGQPVLKNNIGQREYARLIEAAGVRPITFHGLRHTCATLLLKKNTPVHVVQQRLGHKKSTTTLDVYAHAMPSMQQEAAEMVGAALHG